MKTSTGIGFSEITPIKQEHFRTILKAHISIVEAVNKRNGFNNHYYYIDMNAGCGMYEGIKGSPLIFLDEIAKSNLNFTAIFIDKNTNNTDILQSHIDKYFNTINDQSRYWIVNESNDIATNAAIDTLLKHKSLNYGLIYNDPNGIFDTDILSSITLKPAVSKMDLLINCNSTTIKRVVKSPKCEENRTLKEMLATINKREWLIRDGYGKQQWAFLFGTNWDKCPEFKQINMFNLKSKAGKQILEGLNYTAKEKKQIQEPDFFNPMQLAFNF